MFCKVQDVCILPTQCMFHVYSQNDDFKESFKLFICLINVDYKGIFLLFQTDAHNYKIVGILNN